MIKHLVILICLLGPALSTVAQYRTYPLQGNVIRLGIENPRPFINCTVSIFDCYSGTTPLDKPPKIVTADSNGNYSAFVRDHDYKIVVSEKGFCDTTLYLSVNRPDTTLRQNFFLRKCAQ